MHEGLVFNLAARLLGDSEEARDLSQEVFLQVYRTIGRFEGRRSGHKLNHRLLRALFQRTDAWEWSDGSPAAPVEAAPRKAGGRR